jgi:hypothetical protein
MDLGGRLRVMALPDYMFNDGNSSSRSRQVTFAYTFNSIYFMKTSAVLLPV